MMDGSRLRPCTTGGTYRYLLNESDERVLPLLRDFQRLTVYKRVAIPQELLLPQDQLKAYYNGLIQKYIGREKLSF